MDELANPLPLDAMDGWQVEEDLDPYVPAFVEDADLDEDLQPGFEEDENFKTVIRDLFTGFIERFEDDRGERLYLEAIQEMARENAASLIVKFEPHLTAFSPKLCNLILMYPAKILPLLDEVLRTFLTHSFKTYDAQGENLDVRVRFAGFPVSDRLRDLRGSMLNHLIQIEEAVVTHRSAVLCQMKVIYLDCARCGYPAGPFAQTDGKPIQAGRCPECGIKVPWQVNRENTIYTNYQIAKIHETPRSVPAGRMPRSKEIILTGDLTDSVRPGDDVLLVGIFKQRWDVLPQLQSSFPVFTTYIEVNNITRKGDLRLSSISDMDIKEIRLLAEKPDIRARIINAVAPSIYSGPGSPEEHMKRCLAMSIFGGVQKTTDSKHRIRGDINTLIVGDPGVAKSQCLKYVEKICDRVVYTTGKGASAVGLTAAVQRDPISGEWMLMGGAMVLADTGVCLIDEFDKMREIDQVSIHEAMEQQSISIAKAGIVTSLHARCAVIAAANPRGGRYDNQLAFQDNVDLTAPILSRFDNIVVIRDQADSLADERLAKFVVASHARSHPTNPVEFPVEAGPTSHLEAIDQELFRKYLIYARDKCKPKVDGVNMKKISAFYADIREHNEKSNGSPITARHVDAMVRMTEAAAKMRLADYVNSSDVDFSIATMLESFIQAQKYAVAEQIRAKFAKYADTSPDNQLLILYLLNKMFSEREARGEVTGVQVDVFLGRADSYGLSGVSAFFQSPVFCEMYRVDGGVINRHT